MMRGIVIFAFFTLSTILVIVLQPGPRDDFAYEQNPQAMLEASRNDFQVLDEPQAEPKLSVPDNVISKIKAGAQPEPAAQPPAARAQDAASSLTKLQAALSASVDAGVVVNDAGSAVSTPALRRAPVQPQNAMQAIAPELRDMSWQTLNALNSIGHVAKAPGQQGSLLNSIVRRSMGHVDGTQLVSPTMTQQRAAPTQTAAVALKAPAQSATRPSVATKSSINTYVVASGDSLALIAIKLYGSALATDRLLADNPTLRQNPNTLRIGQKLTYSMP